jgi:hypothetical protein
MRALTQCDRGFEIHGQTLRRVISPPEKCYHMHKGFVHNNSESEQAEGQVKSSLHY